MRMSKEIKLGIKKSSRGEKKKTIEGGRCCRGQGFALPPLGRLPPKMILTAFFTSFGPDSQPSWRPSHPRAGSSASRAFPFPAATPVRDEIKRGGFAGSGPRSLEWPLLCISRDGC